MPSIGIQLLKHSKEQCAILVQHVSYITPQLPCLELENRAEDSRQIPYQIIQSFGSVMGSVCISCCVLEGCSCVPACMLMSVIDYNVLQAGVIGVATMQTKIAFLSSVSSACLNV